MNAGERVYALRLSAPFTEALVREHARLETLSGPAAADQWVAGLTEALRSLATLPERCAVAPENRLLDGRAVRQLIYQRRPRGPLWRVLFTAHDASESDPPTVWVHVLRHGAQAPMSVWPPEDAGL